MSNHVFRSRFTVLTLLEYTGVSRLSIKILLSIKDSHIRFLMSVMLAVIRTIIALCFYLSPLFTVIA